MGLDMFSIKIRWNNIRIVAGIAILSLFLLVGNVSADPPVEEWNRTYELSGITSVESFQQTADSGYIIAGNTRSNAAFVLKIGPTGSEQWNKTFGGKFSDNRAVFILQTFDGGYLITGSTSACRNDCPDDIWLIKMSTQGRSSGT